MFINLYQKVRDPMGKVRTSIVKRTARKILELYPDKVSLSFEENKKLVQEVVDVKSKKLRNQIAGYLTHLMKIKKKLEEQVAK